jgi:2-polyprenyl-3-methyl-5-hydroxy-6-metoxy-1,4-benzoquinol methylase
VANLATQLRYLAWAVRHAPNADRACPFCGGDSRLIRRKAVVTQLRECGQCALRFRVPKESVTRAQVFYDNEYRQGFTTDCPSADALAAFLGSGFAGAERDYSQYIGVLRAMGVRHGATVLDFGCSWGYGSWQLARAGYRVLSYEVNHRRATYAAEKLGCTMLSNPGNVPELVDCLFAAHVLEHLPMPQWFWAVANEVLTSNGTVACFVPNGEPILERLYGVRRYHMLWGQVHPLLLNATVLRNMASRSGFVPTVHSAPYSLVRIASFNSDDDFAGDELALLARRVGQ